MRVNRLDRVQYNNHIAYVHHISQVGFTNTAWLYGLPEEIRNTICPEEPIAMKEVVKLERNTDYNEFLRGKVAIGHIQEAEGQEILDACKNGNINISNADVDCYYKRLWFIVDGNLRTVQTIFEAQDEGVVKIYDDILTYMSKHEKSVI